MDRTYTRDEVATNLSEMAGVKAGPVAEHLAEAYPGRVSFTRDDLHAILRHFGWTAATFREQVEADRARFLASLGF